MLDKHYVWSFRDSTPLHFAQALTLPSPSVTCLTAMAEHSRGLGKAHVPKQTYSHCPGPLQIPFSDYGEPALTSFPVSRP